MTSRRARVGALIGLFLVIGLIAVVFFLLRDDGCMNGSDGGSCPTLADVNGVRYSLSVGLELLDIDDDLTAYGQISRTNAPSYFAETTVYSVAGFDPAVLLIARAAPLDGDEGSYRMLSIFTGDRDSIWPGFCRYLAEYRRAAQPECPRT